MPERLRPGVYSERVDATAPGIAAIRTDIGSFVGIAESGPLNTPVPVQSFRQFQAHFGGFTGQGYLAYAVRGFFENGGKRCWVVRVASQNTTFGAQTAKREITSTGIPIWQIEAANPGCWGNDLTIMIQTQRTAQTELNPAMSRPQFGVAASIAGFQRAGLVRLTQAGSTPQQRVISMVDAVNNRLYWVNPDAKNSLPYDSPLDNFDLNTSINVESVSYRILVYRKGHLVNHFSDLSLIPEHPNYAPTILAPANYPTHLNAQARLPTPPPLLVIHELRPNTQNIPDLLDITQSATLALTGGTDGLAKLNVADFIGEPVSALDSDLVKAKKTRGIATLNLVDEIAIVAVPDIVIQPTPDPVYLPDPLPEPDPCSKCPPQPEPVQPFVPQARTKELPPTFNDAQIFQVQSALIEHCEQRCDRIAVIDPPFSTVQNNSLGLAAILAWRARFDSAYAALYYPWVEVLEPGSNNKVRMLPPSGHIIGQYAEADLNIGVHKAAANRRLLWTQATSMPTSDEQQEILNPIGINAIRSGLGRGIRMMGARTLSSDPDWRYINVRRLLMMLRKAIDIASQWAVFEPNNDDTRNKLNMALRSFLTAIWQQGALVGASPEQAFFVKCDRENNPQEQRDRGWLLAHVGVAPSKPFEFIVLRVGRQGNELEISESILLARAA